MANCEVKPELWVNRFHQIKDQLAADNPLRIVREIDQQARVIFMETVYGPDVRSIVQEWGREKIITGPNYKITPEGLTCLYAGKEISLRELAVDNVKEQTPQNFNSIEEGILLSAERAILQAPTAEIVFPIYNKDGKIRYLSQWKRKDNLVETAMIDISQDGQDKTLEEAIILMEQMAKEKKGRIKTDLNKQVNLSIGLTEAVEIPVPMIQFIETKIPFTTALHSTVVNDHDNFVVPVLSEPIPLFLAVENLKRTAVSESGQVMKESLPVVITVAEPLFVSKPEPVLGFEKMAVKFYVGTGTLAVEQTSMIQIIEEKSKIVKPIANEEWAQVQKASVPMIQLMETKLVADKPFNLVTVENQFAPIASNQLAVEQQVRETEEAWQAKTENMVIGVAPTEQAFIVNQLRMTEQQPIFEKAVKELSLPLLEISSETAPIMVLRAELKRVVKTDEVYKLETETMTVEESNKPVEEKIRDEIDQEQSKLFLVENFSVSHGRAVKKQEVQFLQLKKMFWRIKASLASEPAEVSLLELELPKDQNQRLYALYHFLQKVVKKVVGKDAIRTRQVTVIAEKEDVNLDLELVDEIEYYLQLLRGRKHAQAFAFVN